MANSGPLIKRNGGAKTADMRKLPALLISVKQLLIYSCNATCCTIKKTYSFASVLLNILNKYWIKLRNCICVSYVTFQELGILIIFDPQGKNGDSSDKNHSPQPLAYPRSKARVRTPSLRRGIVPIFGDGFIHVCGHPRLQRRLLWWRHCHQLTAKKCPLKCQFSNRLFVRVECINPGCFIP